MNVIYDRHKWERGTRKPTPYVAPREFQPIRTSSIMNVLAGDLRDSVPTVGVHNLLRRLST